MEKYTQEFNKFLSRSMKVDSPMKTDVPILSIRLNKTLCQDLLFDLTVPVVRRGPFLFSAAFFNDYNLISSDINWNAVYIIDGVDYLHRKTKTDKPLVRDRALYKFLYTDSYMPSAFAEAIITNPWLNDLCTRPVRLLSDRVHIIKATIATIVENDIRGSIIEHMSTVYTPRGVWGLDHIFLWKHIRETPEVQLTEDIHLVPIMEYLQKFK